MAGASSCCHEARNRRAATAAGQGKKARARPVVEVEVEATGWLQSGIPNLYSSCSILLFTKLAHHRTTAAHPS